MTRKKASRIGVMYGLVVLAICVPLFGAWVVPLVFAGAIGGMITFIYDGRRDRLVFETCAECHGTGRRYVEDGRP